MIRIKDYIFNENEIVKIQFDDGSKEMEIDHKNGNRTFIDGTFEDIEWNYEYSHYINKDSVKFTDKSIQELEEKLNELKSDYSLVVTENKKLKDKVLELSNHIALYSSEETMLKEINKLTAESTEWESKYYLEKEKNSKAIEYINDNFKEEDAIGYLVSKNHIEELLKILRGEYK